MGGDCERGVGDYAGSVAVTKTDEEITGKVAEEKATDC
jgi:hypothetical protein